MDKIAAKAAAQEVSLALAADVLFFNGEVSPASCRKLINAGSDRHKFDNVFLVLVTPGGDPDAAYKIGRSLQARNYSATLVRGGTYLGLEVDEANKDRQENRHLID